MITLVELQCSTCLKVYTKSASQVKHDLARRPNKKNYCSRSCSFKGKELEKIKYTCSLCGDTFIRKPYNYRTDNVFCSKSCSAKFAGQTRIKNNLCSVCLMEIPSRKKFCSGCSPNISNKTLEELRNRYSISQYHAKIRGHARSVYKKSGLPLKCASCGYDKHVDICHIQAVKDFKPTEYLYEVNSIYNLIALCPNHHWELDNLVAGRGNDPR